MTEPWVLAEDDDVLVVGKPAGVNTHRADDHAQEGMVEWVQRRRPDDRLSVLHRLDKPTSGVLLFGKSAAANRQVAQRFEAGEVAKRYDVITDRTTGPDRVDSDAPVPAGTRTSRLVPASTSFERVVADVNEHWVATPHTGRTHQIRIHASSLGMPVLGDREHGGTQAARLGLHAASLEFDVGGVQRSFRAPLPASLDAMLRSPDPDAMSIRVRAALEAREALFAVDDTSAFVWMDRHHDGVPERRVERLGDVAVVFDYTDGGIVDRALVDALHDTAPLTGVFWQRRPRSGTTEVPTRVSGGSPERFEVVEDGARFIVDLAASPTSTGLFLDQRETRFALRRSASGARVLNTFAHTGALSVAAALGGAETLTLDLSKRYLDWAAENMRGNDLDPADHDFMYGDAMEWMERFARKGREFDIVLADPPSSSTGRGKRARRWVAARDLHLLVTRAVRLCSAGGRVFVSTNLHRMTWPQFLDHVDVGLRDAGRRAAVTTQTVPIDHRSGVGDPPYLKAAWLQLTD